MLELTPQEVALIQLQRVARLATADAQGSPHLIPVCFVFDGKHFYSVLDRKPKRTSLTKLKRVRNILSNPNVALLLDHYEEDWERLWYLLVRGTAHLMRHGEKHRRAIALLKEKYPQYHNMDIDRNPVIKISPARITSWGRISPPEQREEANQRDPGEGIQGCYGETPRPKGCLPIVATGL